MPETLKPRDPRNYEWRKLLDNLDAALLDSGALAEPAVYEARRALGRAIGCAVVSAERGQPVTVTARTFPPYGENGVLHNLDAVLRELEIIR